MKKRPKSSIVTREHDVLRSVAKPVPVKDIGSKEIKGIISRMSEAMHAEEDGVALAAPQIGESLRIFLVNGKVFKKQKDMIFINPVLIKLSKKKVMMEEGCLSIRWLYGEVLRSDKATVKAHGMDGKIFQMGASGLLAQVFQHEIDHLDGVLFTDKAFNVRDMPPGEDNEPVQL